MKFRAVTFAFSGVRPDRPDAYYLSPLCDFLSKFNEDDGFSTSIYVNRQDRQFRDLSSVDLHRIEPEEMVHDVWDEPNWNTVYQALIGRNPTHCDSYQARYRRLIGVYLSKVAAINREFVAGADVVFWFDAGHWISHQCQHDFSKYNGEIQQSVEPRGLVGRLAELAETHRVVGSEARPGKTRFHMPMEWMLEYKAELGYGEADSMPLMTAVFWAIHRSAADGFRSGFCRWWRRLIGDGKAGIEENALTLNTWENRYARLSYGDWIKVLCGDSPC